jgi:NTP pyrophosphatase (non-canonical NTP hydrolase)
MTNLIELQKQVSEYDKKYGWDRDNASHIALHMVEEQGEISRRILRFDGYKSEKFERKEMAEELTDLLYLTLKLANKFDIDLENEWDSMWDRYEKKTSRK